MGDVMAVAAYGDAVGAPYEFDGGARFRGDHSPLLRPYMSFPKLHRAGEWTDDTYMAYCILEAWKAGEGDLDTFLDSLARQFVAWRTENGNGIGIQTSAALRGLSKESAMAAQLWNRAEKQYREKPDNSAGNGCLMRSHALALLPLSGEELHRAVVDSTRLTHGDPLCGEGALLWVHLLTLAMESGELLIDEALSVLGEGAQEYWRAVVREAVSTPSKEFSTRGWWIVPTMQQAISAVSHNLEHLNSTPEIIFQEIISAPKSDADTTCAIAGGLMGALGVSLEQLNRENVEVIHGEWPRAMSLHDLAREERELLPRLGGDTP